MKIYPLYILITLIFLFWVPVNATGGENFGKVGVTDRLFRSFLKFD